MGRAAVAGAGLGIAALAFPSVAGVSLPPHAIDYAALVGACIGAIVGTRVGR